MNYNRFLSFFSGMTLAIGALSTSSVASANDCGWNSCPQDCFTQDCCEPPVCAWGYNPSAHRKCGDNSCCNFTDNLSFRADFLWWRPCATGLELGTEIEINSKSNRPVSTVDGKTNLKNLNFKFDPGLKLGVGYFSPCCTWEATLDWTHFHSKASAFAESTIGSDTGGLVFASAWDAGSSNTNKALASSPSLQSEDFVAPFDGVKGRWSLNLDMVDLNLGKSYYVDQCFIVRPFVGLRFARIDQSYHVAMSQKVQSDFNIDGKLSASKAKCDFRSVGPSVGLGLDFKLGCGLSIFGKASGSLVFGKFDAASHQYTTTTPSNDQTTLVLTDYEGKGGSDRCTIAMSDIALGLIWEHCFQCCNRSYPFALAFSWEQHAFYNINNFNFSAGSLGGLSSLNSARISPATKHGDLTVQGLTISAMIGF